MTSTSGSTDSPSTSDAGSSSSTDSSTGSSSSSDFSTGNSTDSSTLSTYLPSTSNYNTTAGSGPVSCGTGFAYHDGTMIDDDATAYSPLECRQKCYLNSNCQFWDYGSSNPNWAKTCRLRSDEGSGPEASDGYSYG